METLRPLSRGDAQLYCKALQCLMSCTSVCVSVMLIDRGSEERQEINSIPLSGRRDEVTWPVIRATTPLEETCRAHVCCAVAMATSVHIRIQSDDTQTHTRASDITTVYHIWALQWVSVKSEVRLIFFTMIWDQFQLLKVASREAINGFFQIKSAYCIKSDYCAWRNCLRKFCSSMLVT